MAMYILYFQNDISTSTDDRGQCGVNEYWSYSAANETLGVNNSSPVSQVLHLEHF